MIQPSAADLLKQRETEFARGLKQVQHFGAMEKQWRERCNSIAAEMDALRLHLYDVAASLPSPTPASLNATSFSGV